MLLLSGLTNRRLVKVLSKYLEQQVTAALKRFEKHRAAAKHVTQINKAARDDEIVQYWVCCKLKSKVEIKITLRPMYNESSETGTRTRVVWVASRQLTP